MIQGIGYDFIPDVLDYSAIDEWVEVNDKDSFTMARRLIREEGLLCGGSSGAITHVAMKIAKTLSPTQTILVILPDSVRNYMTKFIKDDWMVLHRFLEPRQHTMNVSLEDSRLLEPFSYIERDHHQHDQVFGRIIVFLETN